MSKPKFKVGDKVKLKKGLVVGKKYSEMELLPVMVFDGEAVIKEVSLCGNFKINGYFYSSEMLEPVKPEKIIIYRDGQKTIAKNTATGKTGVARCNPADTFDFDTGALVAFSKLTGCEPQNKIAEPVKPKYFTGKIVCVKAPYTWFTVGKIYTVNNGAFIDDEDDEHKRFESVEDLNKRYDAQFIKLVE